MLAGPTFVVSRDVPCSREQENQWVYNTFRLIELSNNIKCRLEVEEDQALSRKSCKLSDDPVEKKEKMNLIFLFPTHDQIIREQNDADLLSDTSSLINQLGRDLSINCLVRCSRSDYGSIAALNRSFRSLIRSGEIYRLRRQMGIVEHWVYFSCLPYEWEAFDPNRRRWMHLPRMPNYQCYVCSDKESLGVGTELLVFGTEMMAHMVYRYSFLTHRWSYGTEMNIPRCLFGSASIGEIAIIAGGLNLKGEILNVAELYNSETGTWVTLPRMNKARKMCSGVFMDGKFYVIGGVGTENPNQLTCGEEFDPKTRKWREIPNMFPRLQTDEESYRRSPVEAPPLVAVVNNVLYAADHTRQELRRYVKESNSWVSIGRLPEKAESVNGWGLGFRACGDRLLVVGGERGCSHGMFEVSAWVPDGGAPRWSQLVMNRTSGFVYNCAVMGC